MRIVNMPVHINLLWSLQYLMGEQLTIETYSEEKFEMGIQDAKKVLELLMVTKY